MTGPTRISTAYISHGGGPLPLLEIQSQEGEMQTRYHIFEMHSRRHLLTLQSTFLNMHVSGNASCWKEGKKTTAPILFP